MASYLAAIWAAISSSILVFLRAASSAAVSATALDLLRAVSLIA